jgi:Fe-S-cluster containining protein
VSTSDVDPAPVLPPVDWARPHEDGLSRLERQVVRGSHFSQAALDKLQDRITRAEASLAGLQELLVAAGLIVEDDTETEQEDTPAPQDEAEEADLSSAMQTSWPSIALRTDPAEPEEAPPIDCDARMHICHAVCCKLSFALSPAEIETGKAKWDLGFPYMIRHESNGYCTHNDTATGRCGIYADRPGVCRHYNCAKDSRIWTDFENMVLNEEWIRNNLESSNRILIRPTLPVMEINGVPTGD